MHALACRRHVIAVEIRGALLELSEVFHRPQRALRPMDLLIEQAAQTRAVEAEARRLRTHIRCQMKSRVGMKVRVAVETGNTETLLSDLTIFGLIELFLRKWREQQAQTLHLHRRHHADQHSVKIPDGEQLAA